MNKKQKKVLYRILLSLGFMIGIVILTSYVSLNLYIEVIFYLIPYFIIGYDILRKAIKGILKRQVFDENFLMAVATVGAMCLGEFREGVAVMLFYQIGELFQSVAVGKSRRNIAALMDIRPDYANMVIDGEIQKVDPDDVEIGSEIIVNPGEKVPIDGIIVEGNTTFNTSALTGESVPRDAHCGDEVISGFINMTGEIKVKTTKEFGESTVSKILDLVENSSMKKSRSENFITKFARYYTPAVCYSALALAIIPPVVLMLMGKDASWGDWIIRALTFLVISCPCALVISIPLSFFGGIGCASTKGILVKGSNYLEALASAKYIVFDKTGTLTKGVFEVTHIDPTDNYDQQQLLYYAAHVEMASSHPISLSLQKAYGQSLDRDAVHNIEEIAGHGIRGTVVYMAIDNQYAGCIVISDVIKETSKAAIQSLKSQGIKETIMLTGDTKQTATKVAEEIGIDRVYSELLPADKVEKVEEILQNKGEKEKVAFVGDGINDAPVLSRVDIGIAMGALGSDAAIEAADIVLMDDDPAKISLAMKISLKTLRIVKENIVFALAVKFICLILGAFGIANMWLAIFADVGVMVIAVINATRALKIR